MTTEEIIEIIQRHWHETGPKSAQVIDFAAARQKRERERWLRTYTKPMPPGGRAA